MKYFREEREKDSKAGEFKLMSANSANKIATSKRPDPEVEAYANRLIKALQKPIDNAAKSGLFFIEYHTGPISEDSKSAVSRLLMAFGYRYAFSLASIRVCWDNCGDDAQ